MKKTIIILLLIIPIITYSQSYKGLYAEVKYDNLTGTDAELLETDMQGLGSINLNYGYYYGYTFGDGSIQPRISGGLGIATKVYRFKNDYVFVDQNNNLLFQEDNANHEYDDGFFSYAKSKLYHYSLRFYPELSFILFDKVMISGGPVIDMRLYIFYKNKYKIGDKFYADEMRKNQHFENDLINIGWKGNVGFRRIGICATYMTTKLFGGDNAPEVYPMEIGIYLRTK
jgi:hypothetical protein